MTRISTRLLLTALVLASPLLVSCTAEETLDCTNECDGVGLIACSGDNYRFCSDLDGDGCFEWGTERTCGAGAACRNDACVAVAPTGAPVGGPCKVADDCLGDTCLTESPGGAPLGNGYCTIDDCTTGDCPEGSKCFPWGESGPAYCLDTCGTSADCRTDDGYVCDADDTCWPGSAPTGSAPVGAACADTEDCIEGTCYSEMGSNGPTGFVHGYCMTFGCSAGTCPEGAACHTVNIDTTVCLKSCASDDDCRHSEGYVCKDELCWPGCGADSDCPGGYFCHVDECAPNSFRCSASNPYGWCPEGEACLDDTCQTYTFACTNDWQETNDTRTEAGTVVDATVHDAQICESETDWYRVDIPAGQIGTFGIEHHPGLTDLDLYVHDENGQFVDNRVGSTNYWSREYETSEEYQSGLGPADGRTYYMQVRAADGTPGDYEVHYNQYEYQDGGLCTDLYSADECRGLVDGEARLYQFPHANADDAIGELYHFDSVADYRWARREMIMLVRHSVKQVANKFPSTKSLGLIDICQHDGITPGYDVNDPRHPESTHDQGGNIDLAYYQTGANNEARVVCGPNNTATDGSFCTNVDNHLLDLPRNAYFLAQLAASPRFRVAGVDKLLAPLLIAELRKQKASGDIEPAVADKLINGGLAYGDGWPFHHHHIHLSLKWWSQGRMNVFDPPVGCGWRMPGDGELP